MDRRSLLMLAGLCTAVGVLPGRAVAAPNGTFYFFNRRIPDAAHGVMNRVAAAGIAAVGFTPSGGWAVVTEDSRFFVNGVPRRFEVALRQALSEGRRVSCVAFPPAGGDRWVISTDRGVLSRGLPTGCQREIDAMIAAGQQVLHVAFPRAGGDQWLVIGSVRWVARGIPQACRQAIDDIQLSGQQVTLAAFGGNGGWVVASSDVFTASDIDQECFDTMRAAGADGWRLRTLAFTAADGWSVYYRAPAAAADTPLSPDTTSAAAPARPVASGGPAGGLLGPTSVALWTVVGGLAATLTLIVTIIKRRDRA